MTTKENQSINIEDRYKHPNTIKEANIVASYKCNQNCIFCCEGDQNRQKEKTTKEIKEDLIRAKKNNVQRVLFMGGEPSVRPDIIELVRYSKNLGFEEIFLITNGRMFSYEKFTKEIIEAGMNHILFSIEGHNSELHDKLTRTPGSFNQLIKGIRNVKNYGKVVVGTNTVITKINYKYLPEIANKITELLTPPWDYFEFIFVNPFGNAQKYFEEVVPRLKDIAPYIQKALEIGLRNGIKVTAESMPFCYLKNYEKYTTELQMSEERSKITPNQEITDLNKSRKEECKVKGEQCKKCRFDPICEGLWKWYGERFGCGELIPIQGKKINNWDEFRKEFFPKASKNN